MDPTLLIKDTGAGVKLGAQTPSGRNFLTPQLDLPGLGATSDFSNHRDKSTLQSLKITKILNL